jgi:hypothetical protein
MKTKGYLIASLLLTLVCAIIYPLMNDYYGNLVVIIGILSILSAVVLIFIAIFELAN